MADDEVRIRFRSDDSELRATGQRIQGFGSDIDQQFAKASSGGGIKGLFNSVSQLGFGIFGLQQTVMGFKSAFSGLFSENIQFETFETQFKVVLGTAEAAKDRIKELAEFGRTTPFELPEVVQASLVLEKFTKGALSTGDGLRLIGDVAAGVNAPINELSMWFGRLYDGLQSGRPVGEAMMRLQELGVVSGDTRSQIEAMQEAGVDGAVVWETFAGSLDNYKGMMDELSKTGQGGLSNIADGIGALKRNLMGGLYDAAFKPAVMFLADFLGDPAVQEGAKRLGLAIGSGLAGGVRLLAEGIGMVLSPIMEFVDLIDGPIKDGVSWLVDNLPAVAEGFKDWASEHRGLLALLGPTGLLLLGIINNWDELKAKLAEGLDFGKDLFGDVKGEIDSFISGFTSGSYTISLGDQLIFGKSAAEWGYDARQAFEDVAAGADILADALSEAGEGMSTAFGQLLSGDFAGAWDTAKASASGFFTEIQEIGPVKTAFDELGSALGALNDLVAPAVAIWTPLVKDVFKELQAAVGPIVAAFKQDLLPALKELAPVGQAIGSALIPVLELLGKVLGIALVASVAAFLLILKDFIRYIGDAAVVGIKALSLGFEILGAGVKAAAIVVETGAKMITGVIDTIVALIHGDWAKAWDEFSGIFSDAWEGLKDLAVHGWETFKTALTEWIPKIFEIGKDILQMFFEGLLEPWTKWVVPFFQNIGSQIVQLFGNGLTLLVQTGKDIVTGLWEGLVSMKDWLKGKAEEMAGWIPKWVRDILGVFSPSKVFIEIGKDVMLGFELGLEEGAPGVEAYLEEFLANFVDITTSGMEMWSDALKIGLKEGASLTTDSIEQLFADLYQMVEDSDLDGAGKAAAGAFIGGLVSEFGATGSLANQVVLDFINSIKSGVAAGLSGSGMPDWVGGTSGGAVGSLGSDWGSSLLDIFRSASFVNTNLPEGDPNRTTNFLDIQGLMSAVQQGWVTAAQLTPEEMAAIAGQYSNFGPNWRSSNPNIQIIIDTVNAGTVGEAAQATANLAYTVNTAISANGY